MRNKLSIIEGIFYVIWEWREFKRWSMNSKFKVYQIILRYLQLKSNNLIIIFHKQYMIILLTTWIQCTWLSLSGKTEYDSIDCGSVVNLHTDHSRRSAKVPSVSSWYSSGRSACGSTGTSHLQGLASCQGHLRPLLIQHKYHVTMYNSLGIKIIKMQNKTNV